MSGDCDFPVKDLPEMTPTKELEKEVDTKKKSRNFKSKSNDKLKELVEYQGMVEAAESNCSKLKDELERLKQLYILNTNKAIKKDKILQKHSLIKEKIVYNKQSDTTSLEMSMFDKAKPNLIRQTSNAIRSETSRAPFGVINNIINGINRTINLAELQPHKEVIQNRFQNSSDVDTANVHGVENVKLNSKMGSTQLISHGIKAKVKNKPKRTLSRSSTKNLSLVTLKKKALKPKFGIKKSRISDEKSNFSVPIMAKKSRKGMKRPIPIFRTRVGDNADKAHGTVPKKMKQLVSKDLVELYHNASALKECHSSETNLARNKLNPPPQRQATNLNIIPPLNLNDNEVKYEDNKENGTRIVLTPFSKNYTFPTIASRLKQVAKYYMDKYNVKSIPFCTAISTSPSHNIGIKIQQVMSMLKTRQAPENISLAYDIGLAAEKLNIKPLSLLASNLTTKIRSECPLSRNMNYQRLREMAKSIPEEVGEEMEESEQHIRESQRSVIVIGPTGEFKVTNPKKSIWTNDKDPEKSCTCVNQPGVDLQQVVIKYKANGSNLLSDRNRGKQVLQRSITPSKMRNTVRSVAIEKPPKPVAVKATLATNSMSPIKEKETKLKEVFLKLHNEFEEMTKRNETLIALANSGNADEEILNEIEVLEKELSNKEEEITMVMDLYKEIQALKNQVKTLRERASKEFVSIRGRRFSSTTFSHLTNLLHGIKHYQARYKKGKM